MKKTRPTFKDFKNKALQNAEIKAAYNSLLNNTNEFDTEERHILFVYGSLKKGFDNHNVLIKDSQYLGKAITVEKFGMYRDSFGNYPYLIPIAKKRIHGELYQIKSNELWKKLDEFEGAPEYYERQNILVEINGCIKDAFIYIQPHTKVPDNQEALDTWIQ